MSFSNAAETEINNYIFKDVAVGWTGAANLYFALCTADPGEAATGLSMSEIAYTNYVRQAVDRATGLTVAGATCSNTNLVQFPICGVTGGVATHVAIVSSASGAGTVLLSGALDSSQTISSGGQPQFNIGAFVFTLD